MELPVCRWRRESTGEGRHACVSPKIVTGSRGVPDSKCAGCFCRDHPAPARPRGHCVRLGSRVHNITCRPCSASAGRLVELPVHSCTLHGLCTLEAQADGLHCCRSCPDHLPEWDRAAAGRIRHLTYHLYPAGPAWRWNIAMLKERLCLFNGSRVVSVATGPETATLAEVRAEFGDAVLQVLEVPNDPTLREMTSFRNLIESASQYDSSEDVTFYGHGKGASSELWSPAARRWTTAMYESLLDYWPAVARELQRACAVGVYRRLRTGVPGSLARWHYSGSFRWTRNKDLYSRDWRRIDAGWCGGEAYPGLHFKPEETACLHGEFGAGGLGLYLSETWEAWAAESHRAWCEDHAADRCRPQLVTCILVAHQQPELVHEAIASVQKQTSDSWQLVIMDSGELSRSGAYARYSKDARIGYYQTGETDELRRSVGIQAWSINEAWRRGLVRGDLVCHLSDDDVYDPGIFEAWIAAARGDPTQQAWHSPALRVELDAQGGERPLGRLEFRGAAEGDRSLDCRLDGMQVCHRRGLRTDWPEDRSVAWHADGVWMAAVGCRAPIYPVPQLAGRHRHTARSTFTKPAS